MNFLIEFLLQYLKEYTSTYFTTAHQALPEDIYTILWLTVCLFRIESNKLNIEYYFPPSIEPNSKYYLENYFENSIE